MSIYGFLNSASGRDEKKLFYRALNLPKHGVVAVFEIEAVEMIKDTLPAGLQKGLEKVKDMMQKALIATTSINGKTIDSLTINRQRIEMSDPRARRGFMQNIVRGGQPEQPQ